jgi:hypothetical protein
LPATYGATEAVSRQLSTHLANGVDAESESRWARLFGWAQECDASRSMFMLVFCFIMRSRTCIPLGTVVLDLS